MVTYKTLLSEKNFLKVRLRARALRLGTDLVAILYKDRQLIFKTASGTYGNKVHHIQTVEITDVYLDNLFKAKSYKDIEDLILNSGLKVHCSCQAWLYWGYKYMAWKRGYGLQREMRRPVVRNPYERGFVCFTAGTKITTSDGFKYIESIKPGDKVISHLGNECAVTAVSSCFIIGTTVLTVEGSQLECTTDHPFLALHQNDTAWVPAHLLEVGDMLLCPSEYSSSHKRHVVLNYRDYTVIPITNKVTRFKRTKVFNLEVEEDESYIAGGVAVHNCKHLYLIMTIYPMWAKTLASKFKNWSESKNKSNLITEKAATLQEDTKVTPEDKVTEEDLIEEALET